MWERCGGVTWGCGRVLAGSYRVVGEVCIVLWLHVVYT